MGQDRIHKGHRSDAMVRIVEAREKYENRADGRVRQRFMEMPDGTWAWVRIPLDTRKEDTANVHSDGAPADAAIAESA